MAACHPSVDIDSAKSNVLSNLAHVRQLSFTDTAPVRLGAAIAFCFDDSHTNSTYFSEVRYKIPYLTTKV